MHTAGRFEKDAVRPTSRTHIIVESIDEDKPLPSAPGGNNWSDFYDNRDCRNDHIELGSVPQAYVVLPHQNSTPFNYNLYLPYEEETNLGSASRQNKNNSPYNPTYAQNNYHG